MADYGPYYYSVIGRGGGQFFSRGALKKFLFCLYLLSAVSRWVCCWCVVSVKKKDPQKTLRLLPCSLFSGRLFRISTHFVFVTY